MEAKRGRLVSVDRRKEEGRNASINENIPSPLVTTTLYLHVCFRLVWKGSREGEMGKGDQLSGDGWKLNFW